MKPILSLVMPALNAERHIGEALASAAREAAVAPLEIILADGGSSDKTREIAARASHVRILEGGDSGVYDGFNRGIAASQGDFIAILNADDRLPTGALSHVMQAIGRHPDTPILTGSALVSGPREASGRRLSPSGPLCLAGVLFGVPAINARFFHREVFAKVGPFSNDIGVGADREWLARAVRAGITGSRIDGQTYHYRAHDASLTLSGAPAALARIQSSHAKILPRLTALTGWSLRERQTLQAFVAFEWMRSGLKSSRPHLFALKNIRWSGPPSAVLRAVWYWSRWRGRMAGI